MDKIISIKKLEFGYNDKKIFNDFSLDIEKGKFITLVGPNGSGKSTLVRIILGLVKANGKISFNDVEVNSKSIKNIISKIGVVFENPDDQFIGETVEADIAFSLENMQVKPSTIKKKISSISKYLGIENILNREPHTLSGGEKQLVALASALIREPEMLIMDEALTMVDMDIRDRIYDILKEVNKNKGITIINITHDMDEVIHGDSIMVMDNGKIVLNGNTKDVISEEKIFNKLGLSLPFMAELSMKLKYYGLVDDIILDMNEMVDVLWK